MQIEGQKAAQAQAQKESAVLSKVEKIRIDQTRRADNLEKEAKDAETKVSCSACWHASSQNLIQSVMEVFLLTPLTCTDHVLAAGL